MAQDACLTASCRQEYPQARMVIGGASAQDTCQNASCRQGCPAQQGIYTLQVDNSDKDLYLGERYI